MLPVMLCAILLARLQVMLLVILLAILYAKLYVMSRIIMSRARRHASEVASSACSLFNIMHKVTCKVISCK